MTWFEAFALFGVPLSVLAIGWALVWIEGRADRHEEQQRHAAQ